VVSPYRWASLVLPQIAAARIWDNARDARETAELAEKAYAWKISDYRRMGLP